MVRRGRMKYVPRLIIDEIEAIKLEEELESDSEAMRRIAKICRKSRESRVFRSFNSDMFRRTL